MGAQGLSDMVPALMSQDHSSWPPLTHRSLGVLCESERVAQATKHLSHETVRGFDSVCDLIIILNKNAWYIHSSWPSPIFPVHLQSLSRPPLPSLTPRATLTGGYYHLSFTKKLKKVTSPSYWSSDWKPSLTQVLWLQSPRFSPASGKVPNVWFSGCSLN